MPIYTSMPATLRPPYRNEWRQYRRCWQSGQLADAWSHLERAHIIGQRYPVAHTAVHWEMLRFGVRIKDFREVVGQIPRLLVGGVKSFVGRVPVGNPGGANVAPLDTFPLPPDLAALLAQVRR